MNDVAVNGGPPAEDGMVSDLIGHPHTVAHLVTVLTEHALALSERAVRAPSLVRISAGPVQVEISWPVAPPAPAEIGVSQPVSAAATAGVPAVPQPAIAAAPSGVFPLCADTVGTFYRATEPGAVPFVTEGDRVQPGQQVAIIEAMKLMIPVQAERAGEVVEFLVADRAPVEYGQPLMLVREAAP